MKASCPSRSWVSTPGHGSGLLVVRYAHWRVHESPPDWAHRGVMGCEDLDDENGPSMRPESTLLLLGRQEIEALLDLPSMVATQRAAFTELDSGRAQLGARVLLANEEDGSVVFSYAARLNLAEAPVCKFGSVVPDNEQRGLPTVAAIVVALHPETGRPVAVLDGEAITNARTAAASVVAAQALAAK